MIAGSHFHNRAVEHFHVVFTLPVALHPLVRHHLRRLYDLLFRAADHKGVIRHKWLGSPGEEVMNAALQQLLKKAERDAQSGQ